MKVLQIHFDNAGRPSLGLVTGADPEEIDFSDFKHFPILVLADDVEIEFI